ncbi:hypothetical protein VE01_07785 [Pseudogymnoascus verrucosus]|uniref:C2H2-type domain-containing protein n=1 Tax=Pseudogymnoascus verrucosus TaxID=342668 RepID=A0A1B8GEP3_9PEZI|nr:uncharacterized protein VE01_07785 [Pseudogymnoascus verrucosus]OBT94300.2 hypothetical protein VE01_07785 [Pseudogymnoascus verrucosus]
MAHMTNNNYNYGSNYPPGNNRAPTSQQGFATSSATAGDPYHGAKTTATPTRTYPNNDYQYQQYPQQASANNGGGYNWGVYSGGKATAATGMESLSNPSVPEQTLSTTTKSNAQNTYDTSGPGNLAYASGLNYNSAAEMAQNTARYSGASVYQNTPSQVNDRPRQDSTNSRASPATGIHSQIHAPAPAAGIKKGAEYNLPTPSPAYPQSLINSYPQRSTNTTMPSGGTTVTSRAPHTMEPSSRNIQQCQYAPYTPSQPQKPAAARAFKQEQSRQKSTPPVAPVARSTANTSSNAYINQPRSQAARGPNNQSGRAIQTCPPPAATLPPAKMPTNVIRRISDGQTPTTQNINSQPNKYQPAPTSQLPPTSNYLPLPTQVSTARNQQLPQPQRRPSPDRPTTVDPSHVYNSYHEYQKQIEAAEAEAARLAKLKEMAAAEEQQQQEALRAQQQRERADMTGAAVEAAMTLTHAMSANNAAEPESESEESEEDDQGQDSNNADEDNEDEQQDTAVPTSENISHPVSAAPVNSKGKASAPSIPKQMAGPPEPPKDDTAVTMEEEMRRMVERLRDYQSKDPKLFLRVWSSVRKTGAGQSPQPQAEGSQTQGSPVTQSVEAPLKSPTSVVSQPAEAPKATPVVSAPVSAPAPSPAPKGKKATLQSPGSSQSPSTQAKPLTKEAINARRREKRPSRSRKALAERAAAELAEAEAKIAAAAAAATAAASTTIPAAQEHALVTPGKPDVVGSQETNKSTTNTPGVASIAQPPRRASSSTATPVVVNTAAASRKPVNSSQQTLAATSQITGRAAILPSSQQGSTWPTDKRDAIAITAATVLNEIPENTGKEILARQIRDMLEGNPSYLELCEMIEKLGFKMDRARFAKTLLAILPSGSKPRPQPPRPAAVTPTLWQTASVTSAPQAQASQQNTPQPILPPAAGVAPGQAARISPLTPGTTQAPPQASQTPGSGTPNNGIERRPVGRPRKDGLPPMSPFSGSRVGRGPVRPRKDGQPAESPYPAVEAGRGRGRPRNDERLVDEQSIYPSRAEEGQENHVAPVPAVQGAPNAATTATTTAPDTSKSVATDSPNSPAQAPLPTSVTATSPNAPGLHPQSALATTAPPNASATAAPPTATEQPNAPRASEGLGRSAPLTTEEIHHMSLLQADVGMGKPRRVSKPDSGGAGNTYSSPYQNDVAPPPKGGWKTWRDSTANSTTTPTHPYPTRHNISNPIPHPPHHNISNPSPAMGGPSPPVQYNSQFGTPTGPHGPPQHGPPQYGPPQYGPPQHGPFLPVAYPYHHHGKQLLPNAYAAPQPAWAPAPVPPAAPLTKEAQARKRTFAEIIDLTKGESSDKGEVHNEKRQRVDATAGDRINNLSVGHGPITGEVPTRPRQPKPLPFQHHHQPHLNPPPHNNTTNITVNPQVQITRNPLLEYGGIVKSIDRSLALRRSRYDPKTIARDILISTGKHPTQRGLNAHLKQLKERFTKVDNTSDLSTFRWDIVDPGGAEVGSANMPPYGPNKPVPYPTPLTEGTHKNYGPSRPSGLRNETSQSNFAIVIPDDTNGDDEEMEEIPVEPAAAPAPKRRGRPPRDPNAVMPTPAKRVLTRTRRTPGGPASAAADEDELELPAPKRRGRPPAKDKRPEIPYSRLGQPTFIPFLCEWRGCKAELMNLETLRKHVYVVHGKAIRIKEFVPKSCLWGKCGKKFESRDGDGDEEMGGVVQEEIFGDEEAFKAHMEKAHIVPVAWHMGDGPRGTTTDGNESDHTSYLNSPLTGRPITPSIANQGITTTIPRRRGRAPASAKTWTQWEYWCGPKYLLKASQRKGKFRSTYAQGWRGGEEEVERVYGGEMRSAARAKAGVVVYSREMPQEMREALGVE